MNAKFDLNDGYILEISDNGVLTEHDPTACSGGRSPGHVGLQVTWTPLGERGLKSVMRSYVTPSQARAIASALLSAATEAKAA